MVSNQPGSISMTTTKRSRLQAGVALAAVIAQLAASAGTARAFCGFYVAMADSKLFNKSSKVILARNGQETAITMASDYEGKPKEFAVVVPVPTFVRKDQISVVDTKTIDHLDAYTAPRLVKYYDRDPCEPEIDYKLAAAPMPTTARSDRGLEAAAYAGVKVEAQYNVAEYDVSILSAEQSDGLIRWLIDNGYKIPAGAEPVIGSYIKQKMHFFVAKVNVKRMQELGRTYLQPLQVRYETAKFMLPLRLGTVNANGPQDLIVYALTKGGRVETTNYRTVKVPSDVEVPLFVKDDFANFYKATFDRAVAHENMQGVFVEYAWDMAWCDPCAAEPMNNDELKALGAGWTDSGDSVANQSFVRGNGSNAFVTRLHVRYDAKSFPEDLAFVETKDRENFQGRYILQYPSTAAASCPAGVQYRASLPARFQNEADTLVKLTGWSQEDVASRMAASGQPLAVRHD
jgi:hypothetical protein